MKANKINIILILILSSVQAIAQDFQFSQFYNVPLYQNPSFTGSLHVHRISLHQRLQWPRLDSKYTTSVLSADTYFSPYKSGVGLIIMQDYQGGGLVSSTEAHALYSYEVILNNKLTFRPGLQIGYVSRYLDYAELRFPHQFDNNQGMIFGQDPQSLRNAKGYVDISSGSVLYSKQTWIGFAVHHLNTPNQSFVGDVSKVPLKFSLVSGHKIYLYKKVSMHSDQKEVSITPTFHYKSQGEADQLDLGLYGAVNQGLAGIWYRGIPIKNYTYNGNKFQNHESIIVFIGWKGDPIRIGYSYDFTISRLARAGTGGSHEINITYVHHHKKKRRKMSKKLPCPSF